MAIKFGFSSVLALVLMIGGSLKLAAQVDGPLSQQSSGLYESERNLSETGRELSLLISEVERKSSELRERERIVSEREVAQDEVGLRIDAKIKDLTIAEERLRQTIGQAKESASKDIDTVVSLYERMKPKQAAGVFEMMEPALASGLLARMNPEVASGILANLSAEKSYAISVFLSGRNVN